MVIYNTLCADLSSDFLDFVPGTIVEEKLLMLQDKLGDNFPDVILQYLCDDENGIVQIKGNWEDIRNVHAVLESWMGSCENSLESEIPDSFAERVEGMTGGVFFDKEKFRKTESIDNTTIKPETQNDHVVDKVDDVYSSYEESSGLVKHMENSDMTLNDGLGREENDNNLVDTNSDDYTECEIEPVQTPVSTKKHTKQRVANRQKRSPGMPESHDVQSTVTRSGRVVKKAFSVQDLYPECDDKLSFSSNVDELADVNNQNDSDYLVSEAFGECEDVVTIGDAEEQVEPSHEDDQASEEKPGGSVKTKPKVTSEKRGRKRKSLTKIPMSEVSASVEEATANAANPNELQCMLCDFKTNAKRHLKCHLIRCHVSGEFVCKICKVRSYSLEKDLRAHMKAHFPKLSCNQCDRRFPTRTLRDLHELKYHELGEQKRLIKEEKSRVTKCEHCDHIAENDRNLKDHVARHHMEKSFFCDICSKGFGLKKDMVAHLKTHTEVFYCDECGKRLRSKGALKIHVDTIHRGIKKVVSKLIMCDHCGESCRNATHYKEHMNREHLHVKPFGCPLCTMSFYTNSSLKQHLLTHTDTRQHVCNKCGKAFKHANSLRMHEMSHLDYSERPFACTACKKTFSQKGALIRHSRIHTGEKPYKCRLCDSAFTDYSILRRHMLGVHKVNSRDLCQRTDIKGNRGGPKPERVKVENIVQYKNVVREPKEDDALKKFEISAEDLALIKSHAGKVEEQMKVKEKVHIRIAPSDDKQIYTALDDSSQPTSYVIHDPNLDREPNYVVAELAPHLAQDIGASTGYTVLQQNEPISVVQDLGYPNIPFSVQHITGNDGQNISIQILAPSQDSTPFFVQEKT